MVALSEVRSANAALSKTHNTLTAVFVGATSGIGLATLQAFAMHIPAPKAIIIGRSQARFTPELNRLQQLNASGDFTFLEADVSLIKNIDAVCDTIKQRLGETKIDLLVTSQGYISFVGREDNADGLDNSISLRYYGRVRFAQNLLPLMSEHARVISVLAGGQEGKIIEDDLDLERNYSIAGSASQSGTMMTLSWDYLAKQNPEKSFIHAFPGIVSTGLLGRSATGVLGMLFRYFLKPLMGFFVSKPEDVGERMLYYGTSEQYAKGSWSLDADGSAKEVKSLKEYREGGWAEKVWEHDQRMFERALSQ